MARKRIQSKPGLFGTVYYYDENGNPIGKSRPGLMGGTRVYTDQNGQYAGKSRPDFFAKEVFTDANRNHITTYDSFCGKVHFKDGAPTGRTRPGLFGSEYTTLDTDDEISEEDCYEEDFCEDDLAEDPGDFE